MGRLARVNELGLVIPPQRLDCLGEACPVAKKSGSCFVDEHHLYFPAAKFRNDALSAAFREHAFNRLRLPRCQHNSAWRGAVHSLHDGVMNPKTEVKARFLEEAYLLEQLGTLAIKSDGLLVSMADESAPQEKCSRRQEAWQETQEALAGLTHRARTECEVVRPFLQRRQAELPRTLSMLLLEAA